MPVRNGEKYLEEAIESVLNQTHRNFELIIVNDASTDSTPRIIDRFQRLDSRIQTITNDKNLRLPASLNTGFRVAKGDWHTWTSDDNVLEENCFSLLVRSALNERKLFVYTNYKVISSEGNFKKINLTGPSKDIFHHNTIGACFLYHREISEALQGYAEEKFMYEDYDYWVRIHRAGFEMFHIPEISPYKYRIHENQLSSQRKLPAEFVNYRFKLVGEITDSRSKSDAYLSVLHLALSNKIFTVALLAFMKLFFPNAVKGLQSIIHASLRRFQ